MPDDKNTVNFLAKVPLFQGLKENQLKRLAQRLVRREYEKGSNIVTQGKGGAGLFVIASGGAEAIRVGAVRRHGRAVGYPGRETACPTPP